MKKIIFTLLIILTISSLSAFGFGGLGGGGGFTKAWFEITSGGTLYTDNIEETTSGAGITLNSELNCGNSYWGLNPGVVVANYFTVGTNTDDHGLVLVQGDGVNILTVKGTGDNAGSIGETGAYIVGFMKLIPMSAAPNPAEEGMIYMDSDDHHLYVHNGTTWVQMDN